MVSLQEQLKQVSDFLGQVRARRGEISERRKSLREQEAETQPFTRTKLPVRRFGFSVPAVKQAQTGVLEQRQKAKQFISQSEQQRAELRQTEGQLGEQQDSLERTQAKIEKEIVLRKRRRKALSRWRSRQRQQQRQQQEGGWMSTEQGPVFVTTTGQEFTPVGTSAEGGLMFSERDAQMSYASPEDLKAPDFTEPSKRDSKYIMSKYVIGKDIKEPTMSREPSFVEKTFKTYQKIEGGGKSFVEGYLFTPPEEFVKGGYEDIKDKPLKALGIGASFLGGGFLLKRGARTIGKLALKYHKISKTTKMGLKGTQYAYFTDVGIRAYTSDRPFYTLGGITTTEILPAGAGLKVGGKLGTRVNLQSDVTRYVKGSRGKEYLLADRLPPSKLAEFKSTLKESKKYYWRRPKVEDVDLSRLKQLEKNPLAQESITKFLKKKDIVLSGTIAQHTQMRGIKTRRPGDIDLYVQRRTLKSEKAGGLKYAKELTKTLREKTTITGLRRKGARIYKDKEKLIEFHPAKTFLEPNIEAVIPWYAPKRTAITKTPEGIKVLRLPVQLQRKIIGGYTEGVTGIKPGRMKDIPAYKTIRKSLRGEEYVKVAPETYAKALVKKGDINLAQYGVNFGIARTFPRVVMGTYSPKQSGLKKPLVVVREGLTSTMRKKTFTHELIHYKTPLQKPLFKLETKLNIPYRLKPSEILAFEGQKLPLKFKIQRKYLGDKGGFIDVKSARYEGGIYVPKSKEQEFIKKGFIKKTGSEKHLSKSFKKDDELIKLNFGSGGRGLKGTKTPPKTSKISETYTAYEPVKTPKYAPYKPTKITPPKLPGYTGYTPKKTPTGTPTLTPPGTPPGTRIPLPPGSEPPKVPPYTPKDPPKPPILPGLPKLTYLPHTSPPPKRKVGTPLILPKLKAKTKGKKTTRKLKEGLFISPSLTARVIKAEVKIPKEKLVETARKRKTGLELRRTPIVTI